MMNPEVKAKWVAALRSGEYEQGTEMLRPGENTYCCLGVLADVVDPNGWKLEPGNFGPLWEHKSFCGRPSNDILKQVGLTRKAVDDLIKMNDVELRPFNEIADYIEENL